MSLSRYDFPDNPGADVPEWDEKNDGYTSGEDRTLRIYRGSSEVLTITAALFGLKVEMPGQPPVTLLHGESDVFVTLERMANLVTESYRREQKLLAERRLRESGPEER
jgi:hypothetical protein